jgi:hypothetical protein
MHEPEIQKAQAAELFWHANGVPSNHAIATVGFILPSPAEATPELIHRLKEPDIKIKRLWGFGGVIRELLPDRAPGSDGFVGAFYQRSWPCIKQEILAALFKLFVGDRCTFDRLNRVLITLIPKKADAMEVGDFRPISLVHSFAKLFTKLMANLLRPKMELLVSNNQSAFSKGRMLHDNFLLVR